MTESTTSKRKTSLTSVAAQDGILFVSVTPNDQDAATAGGRMHAEIVTATVEFARKTTSPTVKVSLGKTCIEVHKEPHCVVAVAFEAGAPVVKSLQRTMRKLARVNKVEQKVVPTIDPRDPDHPTPEPLPSEALPSSF